jgi:hypothetical protein
VVLTDIESNPSASAAFTACIVGGGLPGRQVQWDNPRRSQGRVIMNQGRLALAAAFGLLLAVARVSPAVRIPGGGPAKTECYAEFEVENGALAGKTTIDCTDGAACDADSACDGRCIFRVAVCLNQTDISACRPAPPTCVVRPPGVIEPPCSASSACEPFAGLAVSLKKGGKKPGEAKIRLIATSASGKPKTDKDRLTLRCLPNPDPSCCALPPTCPANPAGGPDEIDFVVASQGADLDVGWTGVDHNFPFPLVPNAALKACVKTCGPGGTPPCELEAPTGLGLPNGEAFGPPLPLAAANIPVCIVQRWNGDPTGTIDPLTGDTTLQVNLTSNVHLTSLGKVCPRCTDGQCDSGANAGRACTVEATVTVAQAVGDKVYNLSSKCPPDPASLAAPLDIRLPLTSGTASLAGPKPCAAKPGEPTGVPVQDDNCGGGGCGSNNCTGNACVSMTSDPATGALVCVDVKGGLSQNCCNSDTTKPCFPTAGGGQIVRMGKPWPPAPPFPDQAYPKTGNAVLAAVFCSPAMGTHSIDATNGPGPGALILSVTHSWLRVPQSCGS